MDHTSELTGMVAMNLRGVMDRIQAFQDTKEHVLSFFVDKLLVEAAENAFFSGVVSAMTANGIPLDEGIWPEEPKELPEIQADFRKIVEQANDLVDRLIEPHAQQLVNLWEGFGRFSRETLDIEPVNLLEAWGLTIRWELAKILQCYSGVKPDEQKATEYLRHLTKYWSTRIEE